MNRKEKIYAYINSKEYIPLTHNELMSVLCVPKDDENEFLIILEELVNEGKIFLTKKNRYESSKKAGFVVGRLSCSANQKFAFVVTDDESEDIFIPSGSLLDAVNSDTVMAVIDKKATSSSKAEGHILKVLKRGNTSLSGIIKSFDGYYFHILCDLTRIYSPILAPKDSGVLSDIGDRVIVELTEYKTTKIYGNIIKNLGNGEDLSSNIEAIINQHSIKTEFDEKTLAEAKSLPQKVLKKSTKDRLDLCDELIITIDGEDAKDFDDAVSVKKTSDGYILGVHIADVTEYVKAGSSLDSEAFLRGTSVYLADRVIPMLPFELSNGICSLNPQTNKLTLSVFMKIDSDGRVTFDKLTKSIICSRERMTYNIVSDLLENPSPKLLKKYEYLLPTLKDMYELSQILNKNREKRGSINFDFPESKILVDEEKNPYDIVRAERRIAHKIIEEFMLCANETIAELAFWAELPFVYRTHEPPTVEKAQDFNRFLNNFGLGLKGKIDKDNPIHPKMFSSILDKIENSPYENMISTYMLRSLMKAEYKSENLGHFGLSAKYYCHFTSPIRRYPDLIIHRILKDYIDQKETNTYNSVVDIAAKQSTDREIEAEYCQRDVDDLMKARFMQNFIGQEFVARVSSITDFGMFVELENTVEGLIRLESMGDDYYEFNETTKELIGKRTNTTYKIGTQIPVILVNADILTRNIDFVRSEDFSQYTIRKFKRKASAHKKSFEKKKHFKKSKKRNFRH